MPEWPFQYLHFASLSINTLILRLNTQASFGGKKKKPSCKSGLTDFTTEIWVGLLQMIHF